MMTRFVRLAATAALLAISFASAASAGAPEGFAPLFNGKDLAGWWGMGTQNPAKWMALSPEDLAKLKAKSRENIRKHWSVKDGILINDGHGLYLTTDKDYGSFELLVDYKTVPKADSGVYLRGMPQVQIWDRPKIGSGGLFNNKRAGKNPLVIADKPFGEWNSFRILMLDEQVTVWYNGKLVVDNVTLENYFDRKNPAPKAGPNQLQTHGGEIQWRNIFIREIDAEEVKTLLAPKEEK